MAWASLCMHCSVLLFVVRPPLLLSPHTSRHMRWLAPHHNHPLHPHANSCEGPRGASGHAHAVGGASTAAACVFACASTCRPGVTNGHPWGRDCHGGHKWSSPPPAFLACSHAPCSMRDDDGRWLHRPAGTASMMVRTGWHAGKNAHTNGPHPLLTALAPSTIAAALLPRLHFCPPPKPGRHGTSSPASRTAHVVRVVLSNGACCGADAAGCPAGGLLGRVAGVGRRGQAAG